MTVRPTTPFRHALVLATGDLALFLAFAAIGRRAHAAASPLDDVIEIALPFIVGWALAAPLTRAYAPDATASPVAAARRAALTWLVAFPLGYLFRALLLGRLSHHTFALVAGAFTLATLSGWRAIAARIRVLPGE